MPKKRKTRKEKVVHELQQQQRSAGPSITYSFQGNATVLPSTVAKDSPQSAARTTGLHFEYLSRDLLRTCFLTGSIVLGELILLYFLHLK